MKKKYAEKTIVDIVIEIGLAVDNKNEWEIWWDFQVMKNNFGGSQTVHLGPRFMDPWRWEVGMGRHTPQLRKAMHLVTVCQGFCVLFR